MDTGRLTVRYKANPTGGRHIESQPTDAIDATTTAATHVHHQSEAHIGDAPLASFAGVMGQALCGRRRRCIAPGIGLDRPGRQVGE